MNQKESTEIALFLFFVLFVVSGAGSIWVFAGIGWAFLFVALMAAVLCHGAIRVLQKLGGDADTDGGSNE